MGFVLTERAEAFLGMTRSDDGERGIGVFAADNIIGLGHGQYLSHPKGWWRRAYTLLRAGKECPSAHDHAAGIAGHAGRKVAVFRQTYPGIGNA